MSIQTHSIHKMRPYCCTIQQILVCDVGVGSLLYLFPKYIFPIGPKRDFPIIQLLFLLSPKVTQQPHHIDMTSMRCGMHCGPPSPRLRGIHPPPILGALSRAPIMEIINVI